MKQRAIDFRELLERLLPLDELPAADRLHVQRALQTGIASQLEQAALLALSRLEHAGALRRLPAAANGGGPVVRFQPRDALDVITVHLPGPSESGGLVLVPRSSLPAHAQARLEQMRPLLRLDEALLAADPRSGQARHGLIEQLDRAGRELLGAAEVRFVPAGEEAAPEALAHDVAQELFARPGLLAYCPDTLLCPRLEAAARRRRVRAVVVAPVTSSGGEALGHLEVVSRDVDPFHPDALAMVALLADSCAGTLERATRIEKLVFIDPLTSVYNRSYFDLQLSNEMARAQREQSSMALCIADIDDFKSFNTAYGLEAGNQVLVQVAQTLRHGVRPFDTVARWGGEEFAVLLTAPVAAEDVITASERLRSLVERQQVRLEGLDRQSHRVGVTVSVGVAMFPDHADTAPELWRAANQALLSAKRPPKNQVVFYRPGGDPRSGGK